MDTMLAKAVIAHDSVSGKRSGKAMYKRKEGESSSNSLQVASLKGEYQFVKLILDKGANINAQDGYYGNALQAASQGGHMRVVKMLLDAGADTNAQGRYYGNALQAASEGGHNAVAKKSLEKGAKCKTQSGEAIAGISGNYPTMGHAGGMLCPGYVFQINEKRQSIDAQGSGPFNNATIKLRFSKFSILCEGGATRSNEDQFAAHGVVGSLGFW
jgi:ankyrin repeat protein